jgi:hypothetical protein
LHRPTVHPSLDGNESEAAGAVLSEFKMARTHQFNRVAIPQIHLEDSPPTNEIHIVLSIE